MQFLRMEKRSDQELCGESKFKKDENLLNQMV